MSDRGELKGIQVWVTDEEKAQIVAESYGGAETVSAVARRYGLASTQGKLYVCDTMAASIQIFDLVKRRSRYFAPRGEGRLQTPINIAVDRDGTRYVADTGRSQVLIYGKDDSYVAAMGTKDEMKPTDVAITADRLYVTDLKNHSVRVYSKADR